MYKLLRRTRSTLLEPESEQYQQRRRSQSIEIHPLFVGVQQRTKDTANDILIAYIKKITFVAPQSQLPQHTLNCLCQLIVTL